MRGEAKLAQITSSITSSSQESSLPTEPSTAGRPSWLPKPAAEDTDPFIREYANGGDGLGDDGSGTSVSGDGAETKLKGLPRRPETKEEGRGRWDDFLRRRFVLGRDEDFDYSTVDENDEFDVLERREQEEAWFDDEDPDWASDLVEDQGGGDGKLGEKRLEGETGIQDF